MNADGAPVVGIALPLDKSGGFQAVQNSRERCAIELCSFAQFAGSNLIPFMEKPQNHGLDGGKIEFGNFLSEKAAAKLIGLGKLKENTIYFLHSFKIILVYN